MLSDKLLLSLPQLFNYGEVEWLNLAPNPRFVNIVNSVLAAVPEDMKNTKKFDELLHRTIWPKHRNLRRTGFSLIMRLIVVHSVVWLNAGSLSSAPLERWSL